MKKQITKKQLVNQLLKELAIYEGLRKIVGVSIIESQIERRAYLVGLSAAMQLSNEYNLEGFLEKDFLEIFKQIVKILKI